MVLIIIWRQSQTLSTLGCPQEAADVQGTHLQATPPSLGFHCQIQSPAFILEWEQEDQPFPFGCQVGAGQDIQLVTH